MKKETFNKLNNKFLFALILVSLIVLSFIVLVIAVDPPQYSEDKPETWSVDGAKAAQLITTEEKYAVFMQGVDKLIGESKEGYSSSELNKLFESIITKNPDAILKIKEADMQKIFEKTSWKINAETLINLNKDGKTPEKQTEFLKKLKPEQRIDFLRASLRLKIKDGSEAVPQEAVDSLKKVRNILTETAIKDVIDSKINGKFTKDDADKIKKMIKISGLEKLDKLDLDKDGYLTIDGKKLINIGSKENFPHWFRQLEVSPDGKLITLKFDTQLTGEVNKLRSAVFDLASIDTIDANGIYKNFNLLYGEGGTITFTTDANGQRLLSFKGEAAVFDTKNNAIYSGKDGSILAFDKAGKLLGGKSAQVWANVEYDKDGVTGKNWLYFVLSGEFKDGVIKSEDGKLPNGFSGIAYQKKDGNILLAVAGTSPVSVSPVGYKIANLVTAPKSVVEVNSVWGIVEKVDHLDVNLYRKGLSYIVSNLKPGQNGEVPKIITSYQSVEGNENPVTFILNPQFKELVGALLDKYPNLKELPNPVEQTTPGQDPTPCSSGGCSEMPAGIIPREVSSTGGKIVVPQGTQRVRSSGRTTYVPPTGSS